MRSIIEAGVELSLQDLDDWMMVDEAACLGLDREVYTRMINLEGMDSDDTFSCSDSGTMFTQKDASEGAEGGVRLGVMRE